MEKKATSGIMLTLLLISMLSLTFNVQLAWASGTIYIRPDGLVEGTDKIQRDGDTYTFTDNIYDGIVVERSNLIIDGNGYMLQGPGALAPPFEYGFSLSFVNNVTINDTNIKDWSRGINLYYSSGNSLYGNNITNNYRGIYFELASSNNLSRNNVSDNGYDGIALWSSDNNVISTNKIVNNTYYGIVLGWSSNNILSENHIASHKSDGIVLFPEASLNGLYRNNITNNRGGVGIGYSNQNILSGNKVYSNEWYGIWMGYSSYNILTGNNVSNNRYDGIGLGDSSYNTVSGNNIHMNNESGIHLDGSSGNTFRNNDIIGSDVGLDVYGNTLSHFIQDIDTSNTVAGMPISYLINEHNLIIENMDIGQLVLVNSTHITVRNLSFTKKGQGVLLAYTHHSTVESVDFSNLKSSITLKYSANNTISKNTMTDGTDPSYGSIQLYYSQGNKIEQNVFQNQRTCVFLTHSQNNVLSENMMVGNRGGGIGLEWNCSGNTIVGNMMSMNAFGIALFGFPDAYPSDNNILTNNIVNGSENGISLYQSNTNVVSGNIISNNRCGIYLTSSNDNHIFHNNFIDNERQTFSWDSFNAWDNGYPSGGNYWSNYTGVDVDGDGIGDTPYDIDASNRDKYPLMEPWSTPTIIKSLIKFLIRTVAFWNLPKGTENSLTSKLEDALHLLDIGNENGAVHKLMDLINHVEALMNRN